MIVFQEELLLCRPLLRLVSSLVPLSVARWLACSLTRSSRQFVSASRLRISRESLFLRGASCQQVLYDKADRTSDSLQEESFFFLQ